MNSELENATNQVYQKVGRNVVFFQKLEGMLKRLTSLQQISGYVSEIEQKAQKQIESISKQTLGQVAGLYIENHSSGDDIDLGPDHPKEPWINIGFKSSGEGTEERNKEITALIEERNKLIHQFNQVCDLTSLESCTQAERYLDHQYDLVRRELSYLESYMQAVRGAAIVSLMCHASDYGNQWKVIFDLQKRPSMMMLGKITTEIARAGGWTVLCSAVARLNQEASAEINELKKHYHCKTLKNLMLKADVFEFLEETTIKGGSRLLYRVKSEYSAWVTEGKCFIQLHLVTQP
jgi:hypothetical protein